MGTGTLSLGWGGGGGDGCGGRVALSKLFLPSFCKGSTLKGKHLVEKIISVLSRPLFRTW